MFLYIKVAAAIAVVYFVIEWWVTTYAEDFPYEKKHWRT